MFDVCSKGDTAHIDAIFMLLSYTLYNGVTIVKRVWQQLEYRIDVCRVTRGAHIENLCLYKKKIFSVFLWL
jgi:hypothetical protein